MAKKTIEESTEQPDPPRRRSLERQAKPPAERVKAQITLPLDLVCKLDLLATKQRKTRSALLEEWVKEKLRGIVVSFRDSPECETEAAA